MAQYTTDQMRQARQADLYAYLALNHSDAFIREANSLRPKNNHSISIKRGYSGYKDFADGSHGNSVDYLVNHMDYNVPDAVLALCGDRASYNDISPISPISGPQTAQTGKMALTGDISFPPFAADKNYGKVCAYLRSRGISRDTVATLTGSGLLYQDWRDNAVFINRERDCAEIRGTRGIKFHQIIRAGPDRFWWFCADRSATTAYICEAAIDAVSLYELQRLRGSAEPAYYISLSGVENQRIVERVKKQAWLRRVIYAVDSDAAAEKWRRKNADLEQLRPSEKDWNDDLKVFFHSRKY